VVVLVVVTAGVLVTWPWTTSASLSDKAPARTPVTTPPPSVAELAEPSPPAPVVPPVPAQDLVTAIETTAAPGITLGVAVMDLTTGELATGKNGEREFMAASLTKLLLAVDVLDRHRAEGRPLDPGDVDLITRSLAASDDNAMNVLWGQQDGANGIERVAKRLGLSASIDADSADQWGDTTLTATDLATVYRHVLQGMAPEDAAVIVNALSAVTPAATDGFGQHYGVLHQGASPRHYAKQAWVEYAPAGYLLHSAGVTYDDRTGHAYAIALLSIQPHTGAQAARDRLSATAAAASARLAA
jgi:hypothetical protein